MSNLKANKNFYTILIVYLLISANFILVVRNYASTRLEQEYARVQGHISSFADIRSGGINKWIKGKEAATVSIADNLTVKMYLNTALSARSSREDILTQEQFTSAYLNSVGNNSGFLIKKERTISANVQEPSSASLILIDKNLKNALSIDYAQNLHEIVGDYSKLSGQNEVSFIRSEEDKIVYLRVIKKITNVQSEDVIGYVVAVKKLDKEFFEILDFPPADYKTSKSELFSKTDHDIEPITYDANAYPIIAMEGLSEMAEAAAISNPNNITLKKNKAGQMVFITAKDLGYGDIYLVQSVSYQESLAGELKNSRNLQVISYLIAVVLGVVLALVWKHSLSEKYKKLHAEIREKQKLLQLISENQIQSMFLVDADNRIVFANRSFVNKNKIKDEREYLFKPLASVVGHADSDEYLKFSEAAREKNSEINNLKMMKSGDRDRYIQQKIIPIDSHEIDNDFQGSLVVENDISDLINERMKYEQNLNNSIELLVRIIEERSKYFHNHGQQVHELSLKIAENLHISESNKKALDIASRICNLSLALLPREIINKESELTREEKELFNSIPQKTIALVRDFNFDCPVIPTLEQINERIDGRGPLGLIGSGIMISARIIKVVNDYVAMISERPYRDKLSAEQAIENLLKEKDTKYSKEVVFALAAIVVGVKPEEAEVSIS
jgi:HD-GYP domain-containing protein (c-di-GMP phosphodiesterase class II)